MKKYFKSGQDRANYFFKKGVHYWEIFYKSPLPLGFASKQMVIGSVWEQMAINTEGVLL